MFGMFNKKADKAAKKYPLSYEAGEKGTPEAVRSAAQREGNWSTKEKLVQGCVAAFEAGRPENLRAFVMGYLEFKRAGGGVTKAETNGMDDGFVNLLCDPIMLLLERQQEPANVLATLTSDMSAYYKQIMLDLVLRRACMTNSWMTVPVLIKAGADVNTGRGRPLANAAREGYLKITQLLIDAHADIAMARVLSEDKNKAAFEKTIAACATASAPEQKEDQVITAPTVKITAPGRDTIKKPQRPEPGA